MDLQLGGKKVVITGASQGIGEGLAHAFAGVICAQEKARTTLEATLDATKPARPLLALTVSEVRHLLGQLVWPHPRAIKLVLAWSWWRRCHRSCASYYHTKRRLEAG